MGELKKDLNPIATFVGIFIGAMSAALYDIFRADMNMSALGALGLLALFMALGAGLIVVAIRAQQRISRIIVVRRTTPHPARGLIVLVSFGPAGQVSYSAAAAAINYHLSNAANGQPTLQRCWLLASNDTRANAEALQQLYASQVDCSIEYVGDGYTILDTYDKVKEIYNVKARRDHLKPQEIAADCTGGTSVMSVGMGLALVSVREQSLEYLHPIRNPDGTLNRDAAPDPHQVSIEFGAGE